MFLFLFDMFYMLLYVFPFPYVFICLKMCLICFNMFSAGSYGKEQQKPMKNKEQPKKQRTTKKKPN